jgi:Ca-activated chloride channel family protein
MLRRLAERRPALAVVLAAVASLGWLGGERDHARDGNRLYDAARYDEAVTVYGEGLSDHPDSERLRFNLAAAQYRKGDHAAAAATLETLAPRAGAAAGAAPGAPVPARDPSPLAGAAAYNLGNMRYRLGSAAEAERPAEAVARYEQALLAYKQAMARDPEDADPKFNHEFVAEKLAALKERIERERKEQEQNGADGGGEQPEQQEGQPEQGQPDQQQGQPPQGQNEGQEQEPSPDQAPGQEQKPEQPDEQAGAPEGSGGDAGQEQREEQGGDDATPPDAAGGADHPEKAGTPDSAQSKNAQGEPAGGGESGAAGDDGRGAQRLTAADARALIDAARGEEVSPGEVQGRLVGPAGIGEPDAEW